MESFYYWISEENTPLLEEKQAVIGKSLLVSSCVWLCVFVRFLSYCYGHTLCSLPLTMVHAWKGNLANFEKGAKFHQLLFACIPLLASIVRADSISWSHGL